MKNTGIDPRDRLKILNVFSHHPEIIKVILYGSRAIGNYKPYSDIDITIIGENISLTLLQIIEQELDDLLLPYKIDISIFNHIINLDLIDHIQRVGIDFYMKTNK